MLTKSDKKWLKDSFATKKDIRSLAKISNITSIKNGVSDLKIDNVAIKKDINSLKSDVAVLKSDVKTLKSDSAKIRKDVSAIVDFFDQEYIQLRKRIDRIEEHLGLPPLN